MKKDQKNVEGSSTNSSAIREEWGKRP